MNHASDFGYSIAGQLPSSEDSYIADDGIHFETMISIDGEEPITVLDFYNDNVFSQDEIEQFEAGLEKYGFYTFGGGAGAEFVVRLVPDAA